MRIPKKTKKWGQLTPMSKKYLFFLKELAPSHRHNCRLSTYQFIPFFFSVK